jgi:hypothetical protein
MLAAACLLRSQAGSEGWLKVTRSASAWAVAAAAWLSCGHTAHTACTAHWSDCKQDCLLGGLARHCQKCFLGSYHSLSYHNCENPRYTNTAHTCSTNSASAPPLEPFRSLTTLNRSSRSFRGSVVTLLVTLSARDARARACFTGASPTACKGTKTKIRFVVIPCLFVWDVCLVDMAVPAGAVCHHADRNQGMCVHSKSFPMDMGQ